MSAVSPTTLSPVSEQMNPLQLRFNSFAGLKDCRETGGDFASCWENVHIAGITGERRQPNKRITNKSCFLIVRF